MCGKLLTGHLKLQTRRKFTHVRLIFVKVVGRQQGFLCWPKRIRSSDLHLDSQTLRGIASYAVSKVIMVFALNTQYASLSVMPRIVIFCFCKLLMVCIIVTG